MQGRLTFPQRELCSCREESVFFRKITQTHHTKQTVEKLKAAENNHCFSFPKEMCWHSGHIPNNLNILPG
jgi:hypothetical protein